MNKQKYLMRDVLLGYMLDLVTYYYGLSKISTKGSKSHFSGLIDWLEKTMG